MRELNRRIVLQWRARFNAILTEIAEHHASRESVDTEALADMVSTIIEGGLVLGRATGDPNILPTQLMLLRHYVQLLFEPPAETLH